MAVDARPRRATATPRPRRISVQEARRIIADPAVVREVLGPDAEPIEPGDASTPEEVIQLAHERSMAVVETGSAPRRVATDRPQVRTRTAAGSTLGRRGPRAKSSAQVAREKAEREAAEREKAERAAAEREAAAKKPSGRGKPLPGTVEFWRQPYHPELPYAEARFRRTRVGAGKLTGTRLKEVSRAYSWAFEMVGSARNELRSWEKTPQDLPRLWNGYIDHHEAALGHWFGEKVPERSTLRRDADRIREVLEAWTSAFLHGFGVGLPVFIRAKEFEPVFGDPPARHVGRNTIELMSDWFTMSPQSQAVVLMHEMGHWAIGPTNPRDERSATCTGGWNRRENMCYHGGKDELGSRDQLLIGSNPRELAKAYDAGSGSAGKTLRNNIDNYVAFMWNRNIDRYGGYVLHATDPGTRRPRPVPTSSGKPVG